MSSQRSEAASSVSSKKNKVKLSMSSKEAKPYQDLFKQYQVKNELTGNKVSWSLFSNYLLETYPSRNRHQNSLMRHAARYADSLYHHAESSVGQPGRDGFSRGFWVPQRSTVLHGV